MPRLELADGFRLHYERCGEGSPVLFAHGAGGNAMSWWRQIPAFAQRHAAVAFDHRAFGRSPDVEGGPGRASFGADAAALVAALGLGPVHVVAHSMGARTAMQLLRTDPALVRSLTLSGSNAGCVDDALRARKAELQASGALAGSLLDRALADGFAEREPALAWLYRRIRALNPPRPPGFLDPPPALRAWRGSTAPRLRESGVPLLWIVGAQDRVVPAELVHRSHALTPGSRYAEIPDAGHSAYFERPDAWNAAVLAFIAGVEAG